MCASAPSWSLRCRRIAPQQPASSATSVWMPAASSTRAVALLMLGIIAGCTQPAAAAPCARARASASVRARRLRRRHLGLQRRRQRAAQRLAELHRRREQRRGQAFLQRPAQRALARRPRHALVDDAPADVDQVAVLHARRAGGLAVAAGQAAVEVQLRRARRRVAFEHLLDQVDAAARAVELVAEQLVGRAGRGAEAAVHALAQDGFGFAAFGGAGELGGEMGLHSRRLSSQTRIEAAGIEDALGIERALQPLVDRGSGGAAARTRRPTCRARETRSRGRRPPPRPRAPAPPAARCASQRWAPCHSISSSPARPAAARSAAATGATASRPGARSRPARRRRTGRCGRAGSARTAPRAAGAIVSPPSAAAPSATAACAPRRRTIRLPFHQALASSGSGWPPQACSCASASLGLQSKRSVASAGATAAP